jgi:putative spermidine/putrescine transport system permease protein
MPISAPSFFRERLLCRAALALAVTLLVGPPLWGVGYALAYSLGLAGALSRGFTLEHWAKLAAAGEVSQSLLFSAAVAATTVALATALALATAGLLRRAPAHGFSATALYVPLAMPAVAAALLAFQFLGGAGVFARLAWHLGLIAAPADFPTLIYDRLGLGIVLTHTVVAVPLLALLFARLHAHERVDDFAALARTLGAGRLAVLRRVTLPLLLRRAAPTLTLFFAAVFGSYEIPLLLGAQRPEMLSILARRKFALFDLTQRPEGFLLAVIYALIVFTLVFVVFRSTPPAHDR